MRVYDVVHLWINILLKYFKTLSINQYWVEWWLRYVYTVKAKKKQVLVKAYIYIKTMFGGRIMGIHVFIKWQWCDNLKHYVKLV